MAIMECRLVISENIERYERLLETERDSEKRATIERLLSECRAQLLARPPRETLGCFNRDIAGSPGGGL